MKLLVLGGGSSQIRAIRMGMARGHRIIVTDKNPQAPGCIIAHGSEPVSTFDPEGTLVVVKKHGIEGILVVGTDQPVLTAALAAEKAGIPFYLSPETALAVTNKRVMKERFSLSGLPHPKHALVSRNFSEGDLEGLKYPLVLKPQDSQGQRGVTKVRNILQVRAGLDETLSFSRHKEALLEEYYPHKEITVSGWVIRGAAHIITITDRVTIKAPPSLGVCAAHRFPSRYVRGHESEIGPLVRGITRACGIKEGPIYIQFFIGEKGVLINEAACRLGGAYEDLWVPIATGIDPMELLYRMTEGSKILSEDLVVKKAAGPEACCTTILFFARPGRAVSAGSEEDVRSLMGVREAAYILPLPVLVRKMRNSTQRAGYVIVTGRDERETDDRVLEVFKVLRLSDSLGNNLILDTGRIITER